MDADLQEMTLWPQLRRPLVRQLRMEVALIVGFASLCIVPDTPVDPFEDELACARSDEDEACEQMVNCLNGDAKLGRTV